MEKETNKPTKGSWDNLSTDNAERKPKVIFDVNVPVKVTFLGEPREVPSPDGESVFYIFDVKEGNDEKVIATSAWTLLHELKKLSPLKGKSVEITKKMLKSKQYFEVKELTK